MALPMAVNGKADGHHDIAPYEAVSFSATVRRIATVIPLRHLTASKAARFIATCRHTARLCFRPKRGTEHQQEVESQIK